MLKDLKSFDAVQNEKQIPKEETISMDMIEQEQTVEGAEPYDFVENTK